MKQATEFEAMVQRDVKGTATEQEAAILRSVQHREHWLETLFAMKCDIDAQIVQRSASLEEFKQACFAMGDEGKSAYHAENSRHLNWRAAVLRYQQSVMIRHKEAKRLVREARMELSTQNDHVFGQRIMDLEARVARLEAMLAQRAVA